MSWWGQGVGGASDSLDILDQRFLFRSRGSSHRSWFRASGPIAGATCNVHFPSFNAFCLLFA